MCGMHRDCVVTSLSRMLGVCRDCVSTSPSRMLGVCCYLTIFSFETGFLTEPEVSVSPRLKVRFLG